MWRPEYYRKKVSHTKTRTNCPYKRSNGRLREDTDGRKIQSDKQKNMLTIRKINSQTERRSERKKKAILSEKDEEKNQICSGKNGPFET